jgi:hypothetical protein
MTLFVFGLVGWCEKRQAGWQSSETVKLIEN